MLLVVLPLLSFPLCLADSSSYKLNPKTDRIETFIETEGRVKHLAEDKFLPSNILFTDGTSLKTTDGHITSHIVYIPSISEVADKWFSGFYQLNDTQVVLVDFSKHCLLSVDRLSNQTSTYAGNCSDSGYRDGTEALFNNPNTILLDALNTSQLLVTDHKNHAIREIDRGDDSRSVGTFHIYNYTLYEPLGITQDTVTGNLYITAVTLLMVLNYETRTISRLAGSFHRNFADGPFLRSEFSWPQEVILTNNRTQLLVADNDNHRVRILDLVTNTTSSICTGEPGDINGDLSSCSLYYPKCLMVVGDVLYIGEYQRITRIQTDSQQSSSQVGIISLIVAGVIIIIVVGAVVIYKLMIRAKMTANPVENTEQQSEHSGDNDDYDDAYCTAADLDLVYYSTIKDSPILQASDQDSHQPSTYLSMSGTEPSSTGRQLHSARKLPVLPVSSGSDYDYANVVQVSTTSNTDYIDILPDDTDEQLSNNAEVNPIIYVEQPYYVKSLSK